MKMKTSVNPNPLLINNQQVEEIELIYLASKESPDGDSGKDVLRRLKLSSKKLIKAAF